MDFDPGKPPLHSLNSLTSEGSSLNISPFTTPLATDRSTQATVCCDCDGSAAGSTKPSPSTRCDSLSSRDATPWLAEVHVRLEAMEATLGRRCEALEQRLHALAGGGGAARSGTLITHFQSQVQACVESQAMLQNNLTEVWRQLKADRQNSQNKCDNLTDLIDSRFAGIDGRFKGLMEKIDSSRPSQQAAVFVPTGFSPGGANLEEGAASSSPASAYFSPVASTRCQERSPGSPGGPQSPVQFGQHQQKGLRRTATSPTPLPTAGLSKGRDRSPHREARRTPSPIRKQADRGPGISSPVLQPRVVHATPPMPFGGGAPVKSSPGKAVVASRPGQPSRQVSSPSVVSSCTDAGHRRKTLPMRFVPAS